MEKYGQYLPEILNNFRNMDRVFQSNGYKIMEEAGALIKDKLISPRGEEVTWGSCTYVT